MNNHALSTRGIVIVLLPFEGELQWYVSALETVGFTVTVATEETLLEVARKVNIGVLILDGDKSVECCPLQLLQSLHENGNAEDIATVLLTASHSSPGYFDYSVYAPQFKKWRVACISKPFMSAEHLIWYIGRCMKGLHGE